MPEYKQVIVIRKDLKMSTGKRCSQAAHASVAALRNIPPSLFESWYAQGMKKVVLRIEGKKKLLDLFTKAKKKFPAALVKDAGLTQVKAGEPTCIAIGPADEVELDLLTGKLRLL
jgi:PTH2 family peptidyl-tRNA hydrolase